MEDLICRVVVKQTTNELLLIQLLPERIVPTLYPFPSTLYGDAWVYVGANGRTYFCRFGWGKPKGWLWICIYCSSFTGMFKTSTLCPNPRPVWFCFNIMLLDPKKTAKYAENERFNGPIPQDQLPSSWLKVCWSGCSFKPWLSNLLSLWFESRKYSKVNCKEHLMKNNLRFQVLTLATAWNCY